MSITNSYVENKSILNKVLAHYVAMVRMEEIENSPCRIGVMLILNAI